MNAAVLHALDLAAARNWRAAASALDALDDPVATRLRAFLLELEGTDAARARSDAKVRHEIGNALAIVQANLEGVIDGVLEPTAERLSGMRAALASAGALLEEPGRR